MRALKHFLLLLLATSFGPPAEAAAAKVIKVLPQYLDKEGRHALSPSLFDRDAYQTHLHRHPEERSGIRFAVQWKARTSAPLRLRVEIRGALGKEPTSAVLEQPVQHRGMFSDWSALRLTGKDYKNFGELAAWRATLWDAEQQIAEQRSFLW